MTATYPTFDNPAPTFDATNPLHLWALHRAQSHTPQDIDGGPSCDERGCAICNADSLTAAAEDIVWMVQEGYLNEPDDEEIADALEEVETP